MDETTLTLHPILRKCWMKRGEQRRVPAAGQQKLYHIFGAYNYATDEIIWTESAKKNTDSFIEFLEHFMASIDPNLPLVLVLDNASYHHSAAAEAALAYFAEDGLMPCWLPPYCSDLNPIERFWGHLKTFACADKLFASIDCLIQSVRRCLETQNMAHSSDRFLFLNTLSLSLKWKRESN